jgi:hypothetical protein
MTTNIHDLSPSEFTQEAIRLARESSRNQQFERVVDSEPTAEAHVAHLTLNQRDIEQLYRLMDLGVSKSREAITRCRRFPTDTIRSSMTIKRHESIIDHIEGLRSHLAEETQW